MTMDHDVEQHRTVEAEAQRLLIAAQKPRGRGRPPRGRSHLLQRALNLCEPFLPVALFNLLCTLTQKRAANLEEPHLTKKQRKIIEVIIKSGARLTLGQVADRTRVSRQYVHRVLKKYHSHCMSEILTRRLDSKDLRYTSDDRAADYSYLVQEIERRGGSFPVRSPIDQTLYPDAEAYARHLVEHKVTFSSLEKPRAPHPDCWSEPTGLDLARYYRIFDGKPPIIQPRFTMTRPANASRSSSPAGSWSRPLSRMSMTAPGSAGHANMQNSKRLVRSWQGDPFRRMARPRSRHGRS